MRRRPSRYGDDEGIALEDAGQGLSPVDSTNLLGDSGQDSGNADADVEGGQNVEPVAQPEVELEPENDNIVNAQWGLLKGAEIREKVMKAYQTVARWKRNLFYLPTGKAGEGFIEEVTKVSNQFNAGGAFESVSLMMVTIMFPLLLQKPAPNSKSADHVRYLEKRLGMWKEGDIISLVNEGKSIQNRMTRKKKTKCDSDEKRFVKLMEQGKISAALRCIGSLQCGVHEVTPDVLKVLQEKHPEGTEAGSGSILQGPLPEKIVEEVV